MFNSSINIFLLIYVYLISQKWWRILSLLTMTVVFFNFSLISKLFGYVYLILYSVHTDSWFLYSHFIVQLLSHVWLFATPWTTALQASCLSLSPRVFSHSCLFESVMPSDHLILCWPLLLLLSFFPSIRVFSNELVLASGGQNIGASASASILPKIIQGWFPLGLTGLISLLSKGFLRVFSRTTVQKHHFFGTQPSLWSVTSIYNYWKNHSFDYIDLCWQRHVSAF